MTMLMADTILLAHFGFIIFVIGGLACIIIGHLRNWPWVRNFYFRICHLLAIGFVVIQSWVGQLCPLTHWENALREQAGQAGYSQSFVEHWLSKLVYIDAPPWVFIAANSLFGTLVLASWFMVKPERHTTATEAP